MQLVSSEFFGCIRNYVELHKPVQVASSCEKIIFLQKNKLKSYFTNKRINYFLSEQITNILNKKILSKKIS